MLWVSQKRKCALRVSGMRDIVVDTNVFVHAQDRTSEYFVSAAQFVAALLGGETRLCLDKEFDFDNPGQPGSLIGAEYGKHLQPQSYGHVALAVLLATGRFRAIGTKVSDAARKWSDEEIKKKRDRTFFRVAALSAEKTLVSHDKDDFPAAVRRAAQKKFSVNICEAKAAKGLLVS